VQQKSLGFDAAVAQFLELLRQNQYSENIIWLTPADVLLTGGRLIYVRVPVPTANATSARRMYDDGVANGRGLLMSTICEMQDSTYCHVWYPKHPDEEPQGVWPKDGTVKFAAKAHTSSVRAKPIESGLLWAFLQLRHRGRQGLRYLLFS
jgi:hypothetical protein